MNLVFWKSLMFLIAKYSEYTTITLSETISLHIKFPNLSPVGLKKDLKKYKYLSLIS